MLRQILDVFFTFYQTGLIVFSLQKQIPLRKHSVAYKAVIVSIMSIYTLGIQHMGFPFPDWAGFLPLLFYTKYFSDGNPRRSILLTLFDVCLFWGVLSLMSYAFPVEIAVNGSATAASDEILILYSLIANVILTLVMSVITHFFAQQRNVGMVSSLFILMLCICFVVNECFFQLRNDAEKGTWILMGSFCSFLLMLFTIVLYELMAEMSLQTSTLISDYQRELKTIYTNMLAQQHDLRHRITVAEELLASSDITPDVSEKLLQSIKPDNRQKVYITGNIACDAIIMAKSTTMQRMGIPFTFIEYPLQELPIREADFCVLLGNLLDNAIEGTMRLPDPDARYVKLQFARVWDTFLITCLNSANESSIRRSGDAFLSSKEHPEIHGFGTQNMKNTVDAANGIIEFYTQNGEFRAEITFPLPHI